MCYSFIFSDLHLSTLESHFELTKLMQSVKCSDNFNTTKQKGERRRLPQLHKSVRVKLTSKDHNITILILVQYKFLFTVIREPLLVNEIQWIDSVKIKNTL